MKILIVGSQKQWAIENFYTKYLRKLGADLCFFPAHDIFEDYYHQSILNKILVRVGVTQIYKTINNLLIDLVNLNQFDIIWVFKGMEIFPETLIQIREKGIKLVNYNPDHPFLHSFRGSGNAFVSESVRYYDAHFSYSLPVLHKIETQFEIPCGWLPFAFEPAAFKFPEENNEIIKACFIGNPDPYRAKIIKELLSESISIDVYGNNWGKYLNQSEYLHIHPPIYKLDFNKIAPQYRLQLNIFRPHNDNSHNMRTFEMPALGCIVLAPDSEEHRLLFEVDKEIFLYKDLTDMVSISKAILNLSYNNALKFRLASYKKTLVFGYNYEERSKQVFDWMKQIIDGSFQFYPNKLN